MAAIQSHPLGELLQCPLATMNLLKGVVQCISVDAGQVVFRQSEACRGLYLVISGQFLRRTERRSTRLILGLARAGDLVELAAALGDSPHTCTLSAQTDGALLLVPLQALNQAFEGFPPMRMRLLEELAREVSRGYDACCENKMPKTRRRSPAVPAI
jgi:CRP-like cAMP-binding protein